MQGAWKVGLLVVAFIALLIGAYSILGQSLFRPKTDTYFAIFSDAGGAIEGTPVQMAGVKIGSVKGVELIGPKTARIELEIDRKYTIPVGSKATIQTALIGFSQAPITILPPDKPVALKLPPGSEIPGVRSSAIDSMLPEAKTTLKELDRTLTATRTWLEDQKLRGSITKLMETTNKTAEQFAMLAKHADSLLGQNQAIINHAVADAAAAMSDLRKSASIVAEFAGDKRWKNDLVSMTASLNRTTEKADKLVENLNSFVTDSQLRQAVTQTANNAAKISETGTRIAANTEEITKNGVIVSQKAIELADEAKDLAKSAKGVLERLQGVFGGGKVPSAGSLLSGVTPSLDVIRESKPGHLRTDVNVALPLKDQTLHLGLYDAFESNKVNAELGKPIGPYSEFLYGIYASKPAIGVDYRIAPRLFLRGDFFDINNPRADLRARFEFGNGFYGWLGLERLFKDNAPLFGVGFRK